MADLPAFIESVHRAMRGLTTTDRGTEVEKRKPAIAISRSVTPEAVICLECGLSAKMLKRHLRTSHSLSPEEYRARWNLAGDYPLIAPLYSEERGRMAKEIGLGQSRRKGKAVRKARV